MKNLLCGLVVLGLLQSCGGFKAERVDAAKSDEKALTITDNWVSADTTQVIKDVVKMMRDHRGYQAAVAARGGKPPAVFIGEVQNDTAEAYFPIGDLNDEFLTELSSSGDFVLVDAAAREHVLKEITYQNDGMVTPETAKQIGNQTGADWIIFGNVHMKPEQRDGKTIKEYSVNIRMTDIQKGTEILRVRTKLYKYSEQKSAGW